MPGKMEIQCQNTYDPVFHILTKSIITEQDGTKREICPLFYGQMIRERNGRFFYDQEMPVDYFRKAEILKANGWSTWYHYNNWINASVKYPEHEGYKTDEALKKCLIDQLEDFKKWVNSFRAERELPPLDDETIRTCFEIIQNFSKEWDKKGGKRIFQILENLAGKKPMTKQEMLEAYSKIAKASSTLDD